MEEKPYYAIEKRNGVTSFTTYYPEWSTKKLLALEKERELYYQLVLVESIIFSSLFPDCQSSTPPHLRVIRG